MTTASLLVVNGHVWPPDGRSTALAVAGDTIAAIGTDDEILGMRDGTEVFDARGATILPAFNDAHVHFLMGSRSLGELDLHGAETQSEVERRILSYASARTSARTDRWIVGRGWFYSAFPGGMPDVDLLDRLVPDRPAYLESFDAHTGWANSKALDIAGIAARDVLKEAAMLLVTRHVPKRTTAEELEALQAGMALAASRGIGSVQEAGEGQDQVSLWSALQDAGRLRLRVRLAFDMVPGLDMTGWASRLEEYREVARGATGWITCGILKAFADGVVESRTASMLEPYADSDSRGHPLWEDGELREAVRIADRAGWQVQVHAIGDAAIRQALDAFEGTTPGRRHRVEHIETPSPADLPRFARLGVVASMQPQHAEPNRNLQEIWSANIGPGRATRGWPWGTLRRSGAVLAFGTDWPVVPLDPAASLHVAATRQAAGGRPAGGWIPSERVAPAEAVEAWTAGAAFAEHAEAAKGALRAGMAADLAVLDRDLGATPREELGGIGVRLTVVGGRPVHRA